MSKLIENNKNTLLLISVFLFGIFPLIPEKNKGLPVVLLIFIAILLFIVDKNRVFNRNTFFRFSFIFIINFLSIFYTLSLVFPINYIETSLALLIVPLAFSLLNVDIFMLNSFRKSFYNFFILSTCILAISLLIYFYTESLFIEPNFKVNSFRNATQEIPLLNGHPIYISLYFAISILFLLNKIRFIKSINKKSILYSIVILILGFVITLLSSKGVIISLLISSITYFLLSIKRKTVSMLLTLIIVSSTIVIILFSSTVERRFRELTKKTTYTEFHYQNSTSIRIGIYKCVFKTIKKSPIIGYGWGEGKERLLDCYNSEERFLFIGRYNSHNQYFSIILSGGIFALITFFFFFFLILKKSFKNKDYIFTSILILYLILFLTENILERQSGLILFIFIFTFFGLTNNKSLDYFK